ncbi:E3 ubiquitin-protein ligase RNF19B isoform X2 [Podarcis raffonei]|uniref:E3 ubiquitin-protein ligase RNF19B isoform X2 n=1 Tax=Podarcis raffonei TaxID=65483 RepID=UPI0023290394|nr:E3 ubiquitin-protein ligase RNF19B isoform X2 [Podarcis raffonei]
MRSLLPPPHSPFSLVSPQRRRRAERATLPPLSPAVRLSVAMGSEKDSESPRSTSIHAAAPPAKCPKSGSGQAGGGRGTGGGGGDGNSGSNSGTSRGRRRLLSFQSVFSAAASAASSSASGAGVRRRRKAKAKPEPPQAKPAPVVEAVAAAAIASPTAASTQATPPPPSPPPPQPPPAPSAAVTGEGDAAAAATSSSSSSCGAECEEGGEESSPSELECPLCLVRQPAGNAPRLLSCPHRSCRSCLRQYLRIEITESRVNISCPECSERLNPADIRLLLRDSPHLVAKYEEFMLRRCLAADPDCRWCPAPDCGYAVIAYGCASCPKLMCEREGCQTEFCYHCKQIWHPNQTCDMARQQRAQTLRVRTKHTSGLSYGQESGPDDIKPCPRCSAYIIKMNDGSCNHMTCAVCGCEFCWLCMKEISDLHYLSPSGCTFWGKKPWSRKKKILWQLGTLIGAPVGISLIAGIAIPAMVIGIPVYVGRKIHSRYEGKKTSKHKRNLAITGGVTLSVIASPVIAAVSVGIGVPIMLAYVYGVVPISLCRGGGCGVSTANGKGVKIEFDEDDGPITVADAWRALKNPSIGESSIEGLTSVLSTSGSPTDGLSVMQGNYSETASFAALSGGTLSGGVLLGGKGKYSRLEVQADVQKEIFPKDSVSLGAISDNASTRAMAGSIISSYNPQDRECNNMEIQVDIETKPSHYQLVSGSSTEDSLHVHTQMAENEEEEAEEEQEQMCNHQSCEQKDCIASKTWDITLAQPESIRSDLESSDSQSDDVPDITSDECDSPYPQTAACLHPPNARGAESPSAHIGQCAQAEGHRPEERVSTLECIEARV